MRTELFDTRDDFNFSILNFHLYVYVAAFQQHFNRITIWTIYLSVDTIYQSLRLFLLSIKIPFVTRIADNMDATHDHRCARWTKSHYRPFLFMTYLWIFKMNNNNMPVWRSHTFILFMSWLIYTITNWRVSLSNICHEWPNNAVTHECVQRMIELQRYLVMSYMLFYNETHQLVIVFII